MIQVTPAVCENIFGQIKAAPSYRTQQFLNDVINDNPEFLKNMDEIFLYYVKVNEAAMGQKMDDDTILMLRRNAALFSIIAWKIVQTQSECNELRDTDKEPMGKPVPSKRAI